MSAEAYLPLLKRVHLFHGMTDAQILDFARVMQVERRAAGEVLARQEAPSEHFYILESGQVTLTRTEGKVTRSLGTYVAGDYFGAADLWGKGPPFATVTVATDAQFLHLGKDDFHALVGRYPQIKPTLQADIESQKLLRRVKFNWLMPAEVVYLVARRHAILLLQALVPPLLVEALVLVLALAGVLSQFVGLPVALGVLGIGSLPVAVWMVWNWVDWGNDFYIITNRRVVYLEKVVGIYDSRQESPLGSILSVIVQSASAIERALDMGNVIVRTFSGPIVMDSVAHPHALAAMVEEHWQRAKVGERQAEREIIREAVRRRLQPEPPQAEPPPPPVKPAKPPRRSWGERLAGFFKVRFEEGDYIIYRKHWFLLVRDIWLSTLLLLALLVPPSVVLLKGWTNRVPLSILALVELVVSIPLALWWLYEYVDWRNDIYQIATDQIIDINRKPLGKEDRRTAPLGNILSLRYERIGLLGLFFNYGTVIANIGNAEFRFEGVFDPMGVQNDIYRRMEALNAKNAQAEVNKRREEIAEWISAYHATTVEVQQPLIRVGYAPNFIHAQALLGVARGEFQRAVGRRATLQTFIYRAGPAAVEALLKGELDLAYVGPYSFLRGHLKSKGERLRILAGVATGGTGFVIRSGIDIQSVDGLAGQRLAVPQLENTQDWALRTYLRDNRFEASGREDSVSVVPIENPLVLGLFQEGRLDGGWIPEPWASWLRVEGGGQLLADERSLRQDSNFVTAYLVAGKSFLETRPDLAKIWLAAHMTLTDWAVNHPAEAQVSLVAQIERLTGKRINDNVAAEAWERLTLTWETYSPSFETLAREIYEASREAAPPNSGIYDLALLKET